MRRGRKVVYNKPVYDELILRAQFHRPLPYFRHDGGGELELKEP